MKVSDLSQEQIDLLNTNFGEFDKIAAAEVAEAAEYYNYGFEKAAALAETIKEAEEKDEDEDEEEEKLPAELKKEAEARAAIMAQGYLEGLMEKGAEHHGEPLYYLLPAICEKLAEAKTEGAKKTLGFIERNYGKAKQGISDYVTRNKTQFRNGLNHAKGEFGNGLNLSKEEIKKQKIQGVKDMLAGGGRLAAPIAVPVGMGAGVMAYKHKKKKAE